MPSKDKKRTGRRGRNAARRNKTRFGLDRIKRAFSQNPQKHTVAIICVVIALVVLWMLYAPCKNLYHAERDKHILTEEYNILVEQNKQQSATNQELATDEGVKKEARKQGYVDKGETAVKVDGLNQDSAEASAPPEDAHTQAINESDPWYVVIADFIFQYNKNASTS